MVDSPGAHYLAEDVMRKLVLVRINDFTNEVFTRLLDKGAAGILFLMP